MSWETKTPDEVTIKQLSGLCEKLVGFRAEHKAKKEEAAKIYSEIAKLESKILEYMEEYGMKNYSGDFGTLSRKQNYAVKQPNTPDKWKEFFNYLKTKGVYEDYITVNSNRLKAFVKQEIEIAKDEGNYDFVPPGIETPEVHLSLSLSKR